MTKRKEIIIPEKDYENQKVIIASIRDNNNIELQKNRIQKKMHIITYGCQQNNSDSEKLKGMLYEMGYVDTKVKSEADVILMNTCCVRENAELKIFGNLGALKKLKTENPNLLIGICGCMMQQEHIVTEIKQKYKFVDMVFGTHNIYKLPQLIQMATHEKYTLVDIMNSDGLIIEDIPTKREDKYRAWITIMYGCNNFCSYCIVPYVRGRERSRNPEDVITEISNLAKEGCKEVTLLGQNVNSYGMDLNQNVDFADLIKMVNDIEGIGRIRFMTSHPKDISDKLIYTIKDCTKVCEQMHLPFQSGSNKILHSMNRKYTREEYLEKIRKVKNAIPGIALSTDIIVGFPGENEEDFNDTLNLVKEVEFDQAFTFIYSKRKGTPAEKMDDQVDDHIKHENFEKLLELQGHISRKINETYLNKLVDVLVEGPSKNDKSRMTGRTRTGKVVNFNTGINEIKIGDLVNVKITEIFSWFLNGEVEI